MRLQTSTEVRRYLVTILARLEKGELDRKLSETLSNVAYKIQMSIAGELKEKEIQKLESLEEQLRAAQEAHRK